MCQENVAVADGWQNYIQVCNEFKIYTQKHNLLKIQLWASELVKPPGGTFIF